MTGLIVSALGFGGVIFTPIVENLITSFGGAGVGEAKTFMVLSLVFLTVCSTGSIFVKNPPDNYMANSANSQSSTKELKNYKPEEILKMPQFYLITASLLFACVGGLMMIAFAKPIAVARGLEMTATIGVMAIAIFNSLGRLFWGMVSDKLGRKNTIIILLGGGAILSLFTNAVGGYWLYVLIAFIGFFYGGLLSNFPSLTADTFGPKHMAVNYGFVLLGFGIGAIIASQVAGYYKNIAAYDINLMFPAFVVAAFCASIGIIMMLILKAMDRRAQQCAS
jgi:OFA family oxalate/formate antiporter-like MFS transporter